MQHVIKCFNIYSRDWSSKSGIQTRKKRMILWTSLKKWVRSETVVIERVRANRNHYPVEVKWPVIVGLLLSKRRPRFKTWKILGGEKMCSWFPAGPKTKNYCAAESRQQFDWLRKNVWRSGKQATFWSPLIYGSFFFLAPCCFSCLCFMHKTHVFMLYCLS